MSGTSGDEGASKGEAGRNAGASKADARREVGFTRTLIRIVVYYALLLGAGAILLWRFPWLTQAILDTGSEAPFPDEIGDTFAGVPLEEEAGVPGWRGIGLQGLSLLGALAVMVPVAWTYIIIKIRGGYDQSVVHTLIILPVAVTGIVIIVQTSVALAFSLAGIVAAVRFRTTLEDTKDAVYVFLAIGVGLAAGSNRLATALLASMVFNVVNLVAPRYAPGRLRDTSGWRNGRAGRLARTPELPEPSAHLRRQGPRRSKIGVPSATGRE